jgi:hypothetical protein
MRAPRRSGNRNPPITAGVFWATPLNAGASVGLALVARNVQADQQQRRRVIATDCGRLRRGGGAAGCQQVARGQHAGGELIVFALAFFGINSAAGKLRRQETDDEGKQAGPQVQHTNSTAKMFYIKSSGYMRDGLVVWILEGEEIDFTEGEFADLVFHLKRRKLFAYLREARPAVLDALQIRFRKSIEELGLEDEDLESRLETALVDLSYRVAR